jgi:hypothetical protein
MKYICTPPHLYNINHGTIILCRYDGMKITEAKVRYRDYSKFRHNMQI